MELKCKNPKCKNVWEYKGKSIFWATCSKCKSSVKVKEEEDEEE